MSRGKKKGWNGTFEERFWRRVKKLDGCWIWQGSLSQNYGRLTLDDRRKAFAHRYSYELAYGHIPEGLCVLHKCDNPPCVRPDHLFLGTRKDNRADCVSKNRQAKGETDGYHKLTAREVVQIREQYKLSPLGTPGAYSLKGIAKRFRISKQTVWDIIHRRRWQHLA